MSSFTFADHKTGGRLTTVVDAIAAGHLNKAAGILAELADEINQEATQAGLLAPDGELPLQPPVARQEPPAPQLATASAPADLQMCGRNVHNFGPSDPVSGWRTCSICGVVNVAPPEGNGAIDMSARQ